MLYSMTGFGKAEANIHNTFVQIEIRALNSKGFDANVRMPSMLRDKEIQTRNILADELKRGKIDVYVTLQLPDELKANKINQGVAKTYAKDIMELAESLNLPTQDIVAQVLKLPNVLSVEEDVLEEDEWNEIEKLLYEACSRLMNFREQEGQQTEKMMLDALAVIEEELATIPNYEQERIDTVRERITKNLEQYNQTAELDNNRLEQELVYYIEKYDIAEEKMRLQLHIEHFRELLQTEEQIAKGKKLNFVSQEIGREINTIGSKANHVEIQKLVVSMKDQLEQIKEQLANTL